jgi:hypothetical protein
MVRVHRLGPADENPAGDRFRGFLAQNRATVRNAAAQAVTALLGAGKQRPPSATTAGGSKLAYLEPSPYIADDMWTGVAGELRARGWQVHVAQRLLAETDITAAAQTDWAAATSARLAVVDTRGPETPPGAALIIGACAATGRPVLAATTGTWHTLADGREPNWRNLMIQYAVTARFSDVAGFIASMDALSCLVT